MESSLNPLTGFYKPHNLKGLYYGSDVVKNHLVSCLPSDSSKAFIITGSSLANKTPLIQQLESLLGSKHHAGTFSNIREHAPIADLDKATDQVHNDRNIDTIISVGGGSPIDSAKAISYRLHEKGAGFLTHIAIPTTLSVAEAAAIAGYTKDDGVKTGIGHPNVFPAYIFYDSKYGLHTPPSLFASTGIRALDHAVELQYHPTATLLCHWMNLAAIRELFTYLPLYKQNPQDENIITRLFLAAFASYGLLGLNTKGGLGLSHTMGYALGSPYGIPHGITSCMTLGHVVKLKARETPAAAAALAAILPAALDEPRSGDDLRDADRVADRILRLVDELGFTTTLTQRGVGRDQLDVICARATGGLTPDKDKTPAQEKMYSAIRQLVEGLY